MSPNDIFYTMLDNIINEQNRIIARLNRKCLRKNVLIFGLTVFAAYNVKLFSDENTKRLKAEKKADELKAELAYYSYTDRTTDDEKDICCDGSASISKKKAE